MKLHPLVDKALQSNAINFTLTNRLPRRSLSRFVGWFSRLEHPLVRDASIAALKFFAGDLHLEEAKTTSFKSLHDCFTRQLRPDARVIDESSEIVVSPCDAIVGACGTIPAGVLMQAKGRAYTLDELLGSTRTSEAYRDGQYVTLRLTSSMYHRFHAPFDCRIDRVTHIPGDLFNVNPPALRRVPRLFCRNERAIVHACLEGSSEPLALVAVGAILVGSIQLHFVDEGLFADRHVRRDITCGGCFRKGEELGYFHHGSTIILLTTCGFERDAEVHQGSRIRMGERLLRRR